MFSFEFCEVFKNTFFSEHLRTTASDFLPFIQFMCATQFFLVLMTCIHSVCEHCMRDVFLSGSEKVGWNFRLSWVWFLKLKQRDTRVSYNKDSVIVAWNFIKKRLQHRCFPVANAKYLRPSILKNICEQLILKICPVLLFWFLEDFQK